MLLSTQFKAFKLCKKKKSLKLLQTESLLQNGEHKACGVAKPQAKLTDQTKMGMMKRV